MSIRFICFRPLAGKWLGKSLRGYITYVSINEFKFPSPCGEMVGKAFVFTFKEQIMSFSCFRPLAGKWLGKSYR